MRSRILPLLLALFTFCGLTASAQVYLSGSMGNHDVVTMQSGTVYYGRIVQHDLVNNKLFMATDYYVRSTERSSVRVVNAHDVSYADLSPEFQAWYADYYNATTGSAKTASLIDVDNPSSSIDVILLTDKCTAELIWYVGKDGQRQQLGFEKVKHIKFTPIEGVTDVLQDANFNETRGCITSVKMNAGKVLEYNIKVGGVVRTVDAKTVSNSSSEVASVEKTNLLHTITTTDNAQYRGFLTINDNNTIAILTSGGVKAFRPIEVKTIDYAVRPPSREFVANGVAFRMIPVEGGTFTMGATPEQQNPDDDEKPTHRVTLSSYMIGETEVTQELWQAVMGSNPSYFKGNNNPVEKVSWNDCQDFVRKLNSLTVQTFRLPTEAEWEFAARGGNKSKGYQYSGSNNLRDVAWYGQWDGNTYDNGNSGEKTHPVATKAPNELGIYDMSGNVCEWCQDWYGSYSSSAQTNPQGPSSGSYRVIRGGGWGDGAMFCRSAIRGNDRPGLRYYSLGLRLVLSE